MFTSNPRILLYDETITVLLHLMKPNRIFTTTHAIPNNRNKYLQRFLCKKKKKNRCSSVFQSHFTQCIWYPPTEGMHTPTKLKENLGVQPQPALRSLHFRRLNRTTMLFVPLQAVSSGNEMQSQKTYFRMTGFLQASYIVIYSAVLSAQMCSFVKWILASPSSLQKAITVTTGSHPKINFLLLFSSKAPA